MPIPSKPRQQRTAQLLDLLRWKFANIVMHYEILHIIPQSTLGSLRFQQILRLGEDVIGFVDVEESSA